MSDTPPASPDPSRPPAPPVDPSGVAAPPPPPPGYGYPGGGGTPPHKPHGLLHRLAVSLITTVLITSVGMNIYFIIIFAAQFKPGVSEAVYQSGDAAHKIAIVEVMGTIDSGMAEYLRQTFEYLDTQPPQAVVLRVVSGGGGVTASDQIWHYVTRFQTEHPDVQLVASFGSVAASGGYYIAAPADHIVCEITGMTGSIGVMAPVLTFEQLLTKLGVTDQTMIASGSPDKEDANTVFRTWTEKDKAVLQNLLDTMYERFVAVVALGRADQLNEDQVRALATGKVYTAAQALDNKLIDQIGYLDDAVDQAASLAGVPAGTDPAVTIIRRPKGLSLTGLLGFTHDAAPAASISPERARSWLTEFEQLRFEYRVQWQ